MGALILEPDDVEALVGHFNAIVAKVPLRKIAGAAEYRHAVGVMDGLLDAGAADEDHVLADLLAALGHFIGDYDDRHHALTGLSPAGALAAAMELRQVDPSELPEIGDAAAVTAVLRGERDLTLSDIRRVAARLGLSPAVFV